VHELDAGLDEVDVGGQVGREVVLVTGDAHFAGVAVLVYVVFGLEELLCFCDGGVDLKLVSMMVSTVYEENIHASHCLFSVCVILSMPIDSSQLFTVSTVA